VTLQDPYVVVLVLWMHRPCCRFGCSTAIRLFYRLSSGSYAGSTSNGIVHALQLSFSLAACGSVLMSPVRVNRYLREKLQFLLQFALSRHTARLVRYAAKMPSSAREWVQERWINTWITLLYSLL
jgi:hypothetical protein